MNEQQATGQRKKFGGRKPGSKNRTSLEMKKVLEKTFQDLGGHEHLLEWAAEHPSEFYTKLLSRLIPRELKAEVETTQPSQVTIYLPDNGRGDTEQPVIEIGDKDSEGAA